MADLRIYPGYFVAPSYVGIWKDEHSLQFSVKLTHSIEHMVFQITESLPTYPEHQKSSYSKNQRTPLDLPAAYTPSGRDQCSRIRLELVSHSPLHL